MYVPWRRVLSWHCSACGECCRKFKPKLTFYEYLRLRQTGFVEEKAGRFYIKKIGNKCPFQVGNLCSLQGERKPLSCKVFPFLVRKKGGKGEESALYEYDGEEYYVYVSTECPNTVVAKSESNTLEPLVREAVELVLGRKKKSEMITGKSLNFAKCS